MLDEIRASLVEIGLTKKETDVYLSMLELGTASVQDIANKADVNRSTTYSTIESLKGRGLIRVFERDNKVVYAPEPPERLHALLEVQLHSLLTKKEEVTALLPKISTLFPGETGKPRFRYYQSNELEELFIREIRCSHHPIWSLCVVDQHVVDSINRLPDIWMDRQRLSRGRMLLVRRLNDQIPSLLLGGELEVRELRDSSLVSGELLLIGPRCYFIRHEPDGVSLGMENSLHVDLMRGMYDTLWACGTEKQSNGRI